MGSMRVFFCQIFSHVWWFFKLKRTKSAATQEKNAKTSLALTREHGRYGKDNGSVLPPANLAIFGQKVPMHMAISSKIWQFLAKSAKVAISSEIWRFLAKKCQCGDFLWNFAIYGQIAQMCNFQWNLVIMCQFGDFW